MPNSVRSRTAPLAPRRMSGPVRRPIPAGPPVRGRTSAFERIARLPDYRLVDRLLRSRACIWLIGIMLGGIVAMQVSLLKLNTGISNAITTQQTLEHANQVLKKQITELGAGAMIREKAASLNMIDPAAGDTRYLKSRGVAKDAPRAAKRYKPKSQKAMDVMANGGKEVVPGAAPTLGGIGATTQVLPQVTPTPAGPAATPEPLPTPVPTATPTTTTAPVATGPAVAPEG